MRANEFINENTTGVLQAGVVDALPATYVLPDLKSQDPYEQYRFGLALASARARVAGEIHFDTESAFSDNMVVTAYSPEEEETLKMALKLFGKNNSSRMISTRASEEAKDVNTKSPMQPQPGIKRKN